MTLPGRHRRYYLALALLLTLLPSQALLPGADATHRPGPSRYLIGIDEGAPGEGSLLAPGQVGREWLGGVIRSVSPAGFVVVETKVPSVLLAEAARDLRVRYVEYDHPSVMRGHLTPNDPGFPEQYALALLGAPEAWEHTTGSTDVVVAILDTGIDARHPDLSRLLPGRDFTGSGSLKDSCGHGTHVAGIAAATLGNGKGVAGLAQVRVLPVKVLAPGSGGGCTGSFSAIAQGITWAADQGADIISMSLGCSGCESQAVRDAVAHATRKGALVVAAAGNGGPCSNCVDFPATMAEVLAVGCTTQKDSACSFGSSGPSVDLAAPGDKILSTYPGGRYKTLSGTSMSTPYVSAALALLMSASPGLTPAEARRYLEATAVDVDAAGRDVRTGAGRIDVAAAMASLKGGTVNERPVPAITVAEDGLTVRFDGSASRDPDGTITGYRWDLGDGTVGRNATLTHTYAKAGTYDVRLTVTDDRGATASLEGRITVSVPGVVLHENFDDGVADGWTLSGLWRVDGACVAGRSAPNALQYNQQDSCTYATGTRTVGAAQVRVDLSGKATPRLTFQHFHQVERSGSSGYDTMRVQVSVDGGSRWTTLWLRDARAGNPTGWTEVSLDLSGYRTSGTLVRFVFDSVDGRYNAYAGWAVDDVRIE